MFTLFAIAITLAVALLFTSMRPLRSMRSRTVAVTLPGALCRKSLQALSMKSKHSTKPRTVGLTRLLWRIYKGACGTSPKLLQ